MKVNKDDIANMNRVKRLKLINSVTGIKPANLIATQNNKGETNVAIFSSVIHLVSKPSTTYIQILLNAHIIHPLNFLLKSQNLTSAI